MITLDYSNVLPFIGGQEAIDRMEPQVKTASDMLHKKNGPGNDFLGWHADDSMPDQKGHWPVGP